MVQGGHSVINDKDVTIQNVEFDQIQAKTCLKCIYIDPTKLKRKTLKMDPDSRKYLVYRRKTAKA